MKHVLRCFYPISENSSRSITIQRHKNIQVSLNFSLKNIFVRFSPDGALTGLHKVISIKYHDNPSSAQRGQTLSQQSILAKTRTCIQIARSAHTVYLRVLYGSENKQRLFHCTALIGWFSAAREDLIFKISISQPQHAQRRAGCLPTTTVNTATISHVPTVLQLQPTRLSVF